MKSRLFLFLFLFPCLWEAHGDPVPKKGSLSEGVPPPPLHSCIYYQMMVCDIAFIGRVCGLETNQIDHAHFRRPSASPLIMSSLGIMTAQ